MDEKKDKVEQNKPEGEVLTSVKPNLQTGVDDYVISVYRPRVVIDCHMHIQSGNCATLPFLWKQTGALKLVHLGRGTALSLGKTVEWLKDLVHIFASTGGDEGQNATDLQKELYRRHKLRDTIEVAKNSTFEIGKDFTKKRMKDVLAFLKQEPFYKGVPQLSFSCVVLTMDMEYAHLDGYYGLKVVNAIYQEDDKNMEKEPIDYWYPVHPSWFDNRTGEKTYIKRDKNLESLIERDKHPQGLIERDKQLPSLLGDQTEDQFEKNELLMEEFGVPGVYYDDKGGEHKIIVKAGVKLIGKAETKKYEQWKKQVTNTELAVLANPLRLLPLFHYDPRRWQTQGNMGNTYPFAQVDLSGLYLGFKMYTALGYRPWDPRLPILKDFYKRCSDQNIPIVNHCTPKGAPTFDLEKYIDFCHPLDDKISDARQKKPFDQGLFPDRKGYFNRHFVSPKAWREVLDQPGLEDLRLCLAHFGGNDEDYPGWGVDILQMMRDYRNVYADVSYSFAEAGFRKYFKETIYTSAGFKDTIRHRILFGSDWYLIKMAGIDYGEYCRTTKKFLDEFDTSLWFRFTQVNPGAFYRVNWRIKHIAENIINRRKADEKVRDILGKLEPGKDKEIQQEAAWIADAYGPYTIYEDTLC
jgi:predicted TIM-barrel fold metal-dependent hydrolase